MNRKNTIADIEARLLLQPNGCRIWTGGTSGGKGVPNNKGIIKRYGAVRYKGKMWTVHRLMYVTYVGPIPKPLELHHTCDNSLCAEVTHLQPVTRQQHVMLEIAAQGWGYRPNSYGKPLSIDQTHLLSLLAKYEWVSQIADVLGVHSTRVSAQIAVLKRKLNIPTKDGLVAYAQSNPHIYAEESQ